MRWALMAVLIASASAAHAQDGESDLPPISNRPTSGEASMSSGRTLGAGDVLIAGGVGWPGIWAQVTLAPSSDFNLGVRGGLLYGSPIMDLAPGVGGELTIPIRIHLYGQETFDVALLINPAVCFGQTSIIGETGAFARDAGWSTRGEIGALFGWRPQDRLTLLAGVQAAFGFVHAPASGDLNPIGTFTGTIGIEGLISRDTMLFALADGGVGVAPDRGVGAVLFPGRGILRVWLGIGYLL